MLDALFAREVDFALMCELRTNQKHNKQDDADRKAEQEGSEWGEGA